MGTAAVDAKSGPGAVHEAPAPDPSRPVFDLVPGLGAKEIDRELRHADRQTDVGTRRLAFYLADMEKRGICQLLGYPTATVYAVKRLEMGRRHAQQLIAAGRALEELPKIDEAFCDGSLNWSRVRLLSKIAVRETEAAWLERALELGWSDFEREVMTSEKGRLPREGRKGLPQVKIGIAAKFDRLDYEAWEMAKRKLGDERGEPATDADLMKVAAHLILQTRQDGTVPGRERLNDSIYRIVVDRCSECAATYAQTAEGPAELPKAVVEAIACDAKVEVISGPRQAAATADDHHAPPTPPWMRARVLARDGFACRICGSTVDVQAHHVTWRSMGGRTTASNEATLCSRCHGLVHENLVFMSGEAPHRLAITDRDGNALERSREAIGGKIRKPSPHARVLDGTSEAASPLPAVTFQRLARNVSAEWFGRHASLFRWNATCGEMVFEPGTPVEACIADQQEGLDSEGAPVALESLVGQKRVIGTFLTALAAARVRGKPLGHALLLGPPGLGKSTIARAVANALGTSVSITSGPLIKDAAVLIRLLTGLRPGQVLFLDEVHGLPRPVAEALYEAMEDRVLRLPVTDGHRSKTITIELNPFTLIAATTELAKVPGPLKSRFTIKEYLDLYEDAEIGEIVRRAVERDGLAIDQDASGRLAKLARGVPRDALALAARVQNGALASGAKAIDGALVATTLAASGIDQRGLGPMERRALGALERQGRGRAIGISRWAAASGICASVLRECEPGLIQMGLMAVTPRGRMALRQEDRVAVG